MRQLLLVPHKRQKADGYCLAACAQMVLAYWNLIVSQETLAELLGVVPELGAPASRITRLESQGLVVAYGTGDWEIIQNRLKNQVPAIVAIQAGELAHWRDSYFQHAVVVIGYDETNIHLLDPASEIVPLTADLDEFLLAWGEMDYWYATIQPAKHQAS